MGLPATGVTKPKEFGIEEGGFGEINDSHDHGVQRPIIYLLADAKTQTILSY
jgi:hypothetical protein